jgi:hypothetical protein
LGAPSRARPGAVPRAGGNAGVGGDLRAWLLRRPQPATAPRRCGRFPRLAIGIVPVLPGVFESRPRGGPRREARGRRRRSPRPGSAIHVDRDYGNAYPQSLLFDPD